MKRPKSRPRGMVLIIVLVTAAVLSLGAYSYTHWMRAEAMGARAAAQQSQVRWLADSAVEYARAVLSSSNATPNEPLHLEDNPGLFAARPLVASSGAPIGYFSVVNVPLNGPAGAVRFGLENESAKIPLHQRRLLSDRACLMGLPGMTEAIADAILDWIDRDDTPRDSGAEASFYRALQPPYEPRNGTPQSIGELQLIKGVTPRLLFGEDANLDGILNPNENDGDQSWPPDDADGTLDRGWFPYLTLYSASPNTDSSGQARLNLNGNDQAAISQKLTELFSAELAEFVSAYKKQKPQLSAITELIDAKAPAPQPAGAGGGGGGGPQGGGGAAGKAAPPREISSPWTSNNVNEYLDRALDTLTIAKGKSLKGLIDVRSAPAAVLQALPGITPELAQQIETAGAGKSANDRTAAWLLTEGILTVAQFKQVEPYVTGAASVYRMEGVGYMPQYAGVARVEAILDASKSVAQVIERRDLTRLGHSYRLSVLSQGMMPDAPSFMPINPNQQSLSGPNTMPPRR